MCTHTRQHNFLLCLWMSTTPLRLKHIVFTAYTKLYKVIYGCKLKLFCNIFVAKSLAFIVFIDLGEATVAAYPSNKGYKIIFKRLSPAFYSLKHYSRFGSCLKCFSRSQHPSKFFPCSLSPKIPPRSYQAQRWRTDDLDLFCSQMT